jgi:ABC-type polar amino acid transport system ATPase subunit
MTDIAPIPHTIGEPIITLSGIVKRFGKFTALHGVDLEVRHGEVLMIIGPSGSGKSTLLRCINLLERPTAGTVVVDGMELTTSKVTSTRSGPRSAWSSSASSCFRT